MAVKVQQVFNKKNNPKEKNQNHPFFNANKLFFTPMASLFA